MTRVPTFDQRDAVAFELDALEARRARGGVSRRKAQGAHYTPPELVDHLVTEALLGLRIGPGGPLVLDPACGSGNFLVEVARRLAAHGSAPISRILSESIHGYDIDPVAVGLARDQLMALLPARTGRTVRGRVAAALKGHVIVRDALDGAGYAAPGGDAFDLIVGNPPFLNQLEKGTAASRADARRIAERTAGAVRRYADLASAFLVIALGELAPRGRLAFVMPQSFLSTADARPARDESLQRARVRSIWSSADSHFSAAKVRVCGLVFGKSASRTALRRAFGSGFARLSGPCSPPAVGDESWAPLLAEGFGAPRVAGSRSTRSIGAFARATADFRDQYYGLRGAIEEDGTGPRLATTRHIDLASCTWGACEVRALGVRYARPTIDPSQLHGRKGMDGWLEARLVPKVLVSTQTKVLEAFVDARGEYAPLVPLITVTPLGRTSLWMIAAAIASPVVVARALTLYAGSALGAGAIKLSARQLLAMPAPIDGALWRRSARALEARDFKAFAEYSCAAHRIAARDSRELVRFWLSRLGAQG
ncbi:MAG: HsdM family class I SAM-dependent methyltransferase [Phycisphaerales bacterium]